MNLLGLNEFKDITDYASLGFTEQEIKDIYRGINKDYATYDELLEYLKIEDGTEGLSMDVELSEIFSHLNVNSKDALLQCNIYYLHTDEMYCVLNKSEG